MTNTIPLHTLATHGGRFRWAAVLSRIAVVMSLFCGFGDGSVALGATLKTRNVVLITTDGLRWEEVFQGADRSVMNKEFGNVGNADTLMKAFWREDVNERRAALLPFVWGTIGKRGQLWGNRGLQSHMRVANVHHFSYPGYSEFLTGVVDASIDSNDKKLNANTNVFEWLHSKPGYQGRVAAVVNWDVLPWILNGPRSKFPIWSGFDVPEGTYRLDVPKLLSEVTEDSKTVWSGVLLDTFVNQAAKHAVRTLKPRALYVSFGETDDWAHEGAYERYLRSAHHFDRYVGELWALMQSMPEYRDTTTFILTTDHGRGPVPVAWKSHGANLAESAYIWMGVMGPDTEALGERSQTGVMTQSQVASTVAHYLGEDYVKAFPRAGRPIGGGR